MRTGLGCLVMVWLWLGPGPGTGPGAVAAWGQEATDIAATIRLEDVIDHYIEALGGREAIETLSTRRMTGYVVDDRPYRGAMEITEWELLGGADRRFRDTEGRGAARHGSGFDGASGWTGGPQDVRPYAEAATSKLGFLANPQGPLMLETYFPDLRLVAIECLDGRPTFLVRSSRDPAYYDLHFDVETGLLVQIGHYWKLLFYEEADGVRIPRQIERSRKGGVTTHVVAAVEHGLGLEDARFHRPEG